MRIMPFRAATDRSVAFAQPQLKAPGGIFNPGEPVASWDYLTETSVSTSVVIQEEHFAEETGIEALDKVLVALQVDCLATGFRAFGLMPALRGEPTPVSVKVPASETAYELEIRQGLVLAADTPAELPLAGKKGSRLFWDERTFRFPLEGSGGGFPTEAFDFSISGTLPADAAWHLNFRADALETPFLMGVRLLINTSHPASDELLSGKRNLVQSVLFHAILETMLLAVADETGTEQAGSFPEGSVGAVLDELVDTYLGMSLSEAIRAVRQDRYRMLSKLQSSSGFLRKEQ